jgi:pyruvate kinase
MKSKSELSPLIDQLDSIRETTEEYEERYRHYLDAVHPKNRASAANLVHYLALRRHDLRELQTKLDAKGASQLGDVESHVMASIAAVRTILHALAGIRQRNIPKPVVSIPDGKEQIKTNTEQLLGEKLEGAATRIMVTMPKEAADDPTITSSLIEAGMSVARVNCGQDDSTVWAGIANHIQQAQEKTGRSCKISTDLGGPKIRTGDLVPGPAVVRLKPERDLLGRVVQRPKIWLGTEDTHRGSGEKYTFLPVPAEWVACLAVGDAQRPKIWLGTEDTHRGSGEKYTFLPVPAEWVACLAVGDAITFEDTRERLCTLTVRETEAAGAWAVCDDSAYVTSGILLTLQRDVPLENRTAPVGELPHVAQALILRTGDALRLTRDQRPGMPAELDADGNVVRSAFVACTLPEVFTQVRAGDPISFDDGKIHGVIREVCDDALEVDITYARGGTTRLKAHKGINFPRSQLTISGLTEKDRTDLEFVVRQADIVNFSFVNRPDDVDELLAELETRSAEHIGIILKIETMSGYHYLPDILLRAMRHYPIGVMLARGDLAVEVGWKYLAKIQEEIMSMCEAAHVPLVWATQVLEGLAKKGLPTRAEIADVVLAERAECVMLNKGPHIVATVRLLNEILRLMEDYQDKKATLLPSLDMRPDWARITYVGPAGVRAKSPGTAR